MKIPLPSEAPNEDIQELVKQIADIVPDDISGLTLISALVCLIKMSLEQTDQHNRTLVCRNLREIFGEEMLQ